jgi:hypothetical protein
MNPNKEILCYEKFVSLFNPSRYSLEKQIGWATVILCRLLCSPTPRNERFVINIIILYLSLTNPGSFKTVESRERPLSNKEKKQMKRILEMELSV